MADKSVIKIVGKIYEVKQQKGFWRGGKDAPGVPGEEVGSFVARKRIQQHQLPTRRGDGANYEEEAEYDYGDYYDDYGYDIEGEEYDRNENEL